MIPKAKKEDIGSNLHIIMFSKLFGKQTYFKGIKGFACVVFSLKQDSKRTFQSYIIFIIHYSTVASLNYLFR